jgi:hypothetical protein
MSYASRLIADSAAAPRPRPAAVPVSRLDVDVYEETRATLPATPRLGASMDAGPAHSPAPPPAVELAGGLPKVPERRPSDVVVSSAAASPEPPLARAANEVRAAPLALEAVALPPDSVTRDAAPAIPMAAAARPMLEAEEVAARPGHNVDPVPRLEQQAADEGIPSRRLSGIDLVVPAVAAPDARPLPPPLGPPVDVVAERRRDPLPWSERLATPAQEAELQSVSMSIGTIEVIVDAPPSAGPPPVLAPLATPSAAAPIDDPIMRLRRQYVTWPDGG